MKKILFVVIDGAGGLPHPNYRNQTELEYADKPNLDKLSKEGICGMVDILGGIAPESDAAVLTLLGYDCHKYYVGRGPFEAEGLGIDFKEGDLALRCNFATSSDGKIVTDRRVGRTLKSEEAKILVEAVQKKVKLTNAHFIFAPGLAHRAVLVIKSKKKLSKNIGNTDPAYGIKNGIPEALSKYDMEVKECEALSKDAQLSADLVNEFTEKSYEVLKDHPVNVQRKERGELAANVILSRDAGNRVPKLPRIKGKWAILADMPLEVGIARIAGMGVVKLPLPTMTKADYDLRIKKTFEAMKKYDNLYIHLKGPDLFGHDGDFKGKVKSIEDIDQYFFGPLIGKVDLSKYLIVVTADHSTPCIKKGHSGDPVPILINTKGIIGDSVMYFNEKGCKKGILKTIKGIEVMKKVFVLSKAKNKRPRKN